MSHHQDDIIHRSIVAYLRWNGHHSVADAVTKAHVAGPSIPVSVANADADPDPVRRAKRVLIAAFDNFDYAMFWQAWRRYCAFTHAADTPEPVEGCAEAALIMEFFLHLRFAMAPWLQQQRQQQHQQQQAPLNAIDLGTGTWIGEGGVVSSQGQPAPPPGAKQAMERLRHFLHTRGKSLATSHMCMPYFALPQVDSPVNHPTFNSLLQPEWSARLRMKLRRFLRATLPLSVPEMYERFTPSLLQLRGGMSTQNATTAQATVTACQRLVQEAERIGVLLRAGGSHTAEAQQLLDASSQAVDACNELQRAVRGAGSSCDGSSASTMTRSTNSGDSRSQHSGAQGRRSSTSSMETVDSHSHDQRQPRNGQVTLCEDARADTSAAAAAAAGAGAGAGAGAAGRGVERDRPSGVSREGATAEDHGAGGGGEVMAANAHHHHHSHHRHRRQRRHGKLPRSKSFLQRHIHDDPLPEAGPMAALNYGKIKAAMHQLLDAGSPTTERHSMSRSDVDACVAARRKLALLLQALRWRLTRQAVRRRAAVVHTYVAHDLLECEAEGQKSTSRGQPLYVRLLRCNQAVIAATTARLLNMMCSTVVGRHYVRSAPTFVTILVEEILQGRRDHQTRRSLTCAIQKLSLARSTQTILIRAGMIQYLVKELHKFVHAVEPSQDESELITVEYMLALLLNLVMRHAARQVAADRCGDVIVPTLCAFLREEGRRHHCSSRTLSYVHGCLFALIAHPLFKRKAVVDCNLEAVLTQDTQHRQPKHAQQVEYILARLRKPGLEPDVPSDNEAEAPSGTDTVRSPGTVQSRRPHDDDDDFGDANNAVIDDVPTDDSTDGLMPEGDELAAEALLCHEYLAGDCPLYVGAVQPPPLPHSPSVSPVAGRGSVAAPVPTAAVRASDSAAKAAVASDGAGGDSGVAIDANSRTASTVATQSRQATIQEAARVQSHLQALKASRLKRVASRRRSSIRSQGERIAANHPWQQAVAVRQSPDSQPELHHADQAKAASSASHGKRSDGAQLPSIDLDRLDSPSAFKPKPKIARTPHVPHAGAGHATYEPTGAAGAQPIPPREPRNHARGDGVRAQRRRSIEDSPSRVAPSGGVDHGGALAHLPHIEPPPAVAAAEVGAVHGMVTEPPLSPLSRVPSVKEAMASYQSRRRGSRLANAGAAVVQHAPRLEHPSEWYGMGPPVSPRSYPAQSYAHPATGAAAQVPLDGSIEAC